MGVSSGEATQVFSTAFVGGSGSVQEYGKAQITSTPTHSHSQLDVNRRWDAHLVLHCSMTHLTKLFLGEKQC